MLKFPPSKPVTSDEKDKKWKSKNSDFIQYICFEYMWNKQLF